MFGGGGDVSGEARLENANPRLHSAVTERPVTLDEWDENVADAFDNREVFDLIRSINDPEHPLTLEQLDVVKLSDVRVDDGANSVGVEFTPTIPHCSMATLIGLSIRVKLLRSLPTRFKVTENLQCNSALMVLQCHPMSAIMITEFLAPP